MSFITNSSDIAQVTHISITIHPKYRDSEKIVDKGLVEIFIEDSDLRRQPKRLLEFKTGKKWYFMQIDENPAPHYGGGADSCESYHFCDSSDARDHRNVSANVNTAVVELSYMPYPRYVAKEAGFEIVNDIDLSLLD